MADISMCADSACPSKGRCYRWLAKMGGMQAFGDYANIRNGKTKCSGFWPVFEGAKRRLDAQLQREDAGF